MSLRSPPWHIRRRTSQEMAACNLAIAASAEMLRVGLGSCWRRAQGDAACSEVNAACILGLRTQHRRSSARQRGACVRQGSLCVWVNLHRRQCKAGALVPHLHWRCG